MAAQIVCAFVPISLGKDVSMSKFGRPVCPYCGKKVNLLRTWTLKLEGEYRCPKCAGISNVVLAPAVTILAAVAIFVSILVFIFYRFLLGSLTLRGILLMLIPYVLFYILSLFLVRLHRSITRDQIRPSPQRQPQQNPYRQYAPGSGTQMRPGGASPPSTRSAPPRYASGSRRTESRGDMGQRRIR